VTTRSIRILTTTLTSLLVAQTALGQPDVAREHYQRGQTAYDLGRYDEAINEWEAAYGLSNKPQLLFNLGQAARLKGDCGHAAIYYRTYLRLLPEANNRNEAKGLISEVDACSTTPNELPPTSAPAPVRPKHLLRTIGIVTTASGVLLLGTGVYFGVRAGSYSDDLEAYTNAGNPWDAHAQGLQDDGQRAEHASYWLCGIGGAAVIAGGVMTYLGYQTHVTPLVTPSGAGVAAGWSW
jgi:tetratricopeptide (TPR) repeat protein